MKKHIKTIIEQFQEQWLPQTISSAENIFSRFIAGEKLFTLGRDYGISQSQVESAIRFFVLKSNGNNHVREIYDDYQKRRWQ